MHISRVTVHGFKSYNDTVVFGPFAQGKNALVGLNGTGKSNFYSAIGFVLLDEFAHIRIADRKALLHEGKGQSAMTAYVEIVFDNKSHNIPIDNDEVSIRRSIGLKKDEYFIDRKNSTRQDVHNLLESCGFSPSSGYYIVRQGKINSLTLMKDSDRLDLLYDIAGTKFYDQQREESIKMIEESNSRTQKIEDSLKYIKDKISNLEKEKEELEEYEKLDREKRAVEHLIQTNELSKIQNDIEAYEESHKIEADAANSYQEEYDRNHQRLKESQDELVDLKNEVHRLSGEKEKLELIKNDNIRYKTRTEIKVQDLRSKLENAENLKEKYARELAAIEEEIQNRQNDLNRVSEEFTKVSEEKGKVQGQLDALTQIVSGKIQDSSSTERELERANRIYNNLVGQENGVNANLENCVKELETLQGRKEELDTKLSQFFADEIEQDKKLSDLMNQRKKLWQDEDHFLRESRKIAKKLDKLNSKIHSAIPPDFSDGIQAIEKMKGDIKGIYGPVYDLIQCPDDLSVAVSAVGKGRLYNIIVEDDNVGEQVIKRLKKDNSGFASILPLNIANKNRYKFPSGVTPLVSKLTFDERFENALYLVFGKTILANTINEANTLVEKYGIDAVTLEGELFSANGPITGGSKSNNRSPIYIQSMIKKFTADYEENEKQLSGVKDQISEIAESIENLNREMNDSKNEKDKYKEEKNMASIRISDKQDEIESNKSQLERLKNSIEDARRHVLSVEKRLDYIKEFNSQVDESTLNNLSECRHKNDELTKQHSQLYRQKIEIASQIKNSLQPRRKRLQEDLDALDYNKINRQLEILEKDNQKAIEKYETSASQLEEIDEKLTEIGNMVTSKEEEVIEIQRTETSSQTKLINNKNNMDRLFSQISLLKQRQNEIIKQEKDKGALPEAEIDEFRGQRKSELMNHLTNINQELSRFKHVNKKAIEQHKAFTQQQKELTQRQQELQESNESINKLIETLDQRKEEAIAQTFSKVSDNFTEILSQLEPNASGNLVLQRDEETNQYTGVTIRAQFDNHDVVTLTQLSGGQRTLIALTLVFAIQKYAPAPFYLFDEVDSALDDKYRLAVSNLIDRFCHPTDGSEPVQVIFTTFKKELLNNCDKYFAVKYDIDHSSELEISKKEANQIISEQAENNDVD